MRLSKIYEIANAFAPKTLSDEACEKYGYYDNSGILIDCGEDIVGAVFSLDFCDAAIEKALRIGANLIITHHPAIYGKIGDIRIDASPLGNKLIKCIKNGISVISMHLNVDFAPQGIDECLMQGIINASSQGSGADLQANPVVMQSLLGGGYGRVYDVAPMSLKDLTEGIKKEFASQRVHFYGDGRKRISKAASFCGAGADEGTVAFAAAQGADVIVSSDFKHHVICMALELGLSVIVLTHYASETYGFKKYYENIRQQVGIPCVYHTDEGLF